VHGLRFRVDAHDDVEARLAFFAQLFTRPQVAGIASRLSYLVLRTK
jgi:hypothetical protein